VRVSRLLSLRPHEHRASSLPSGPELPSPRHRRLSPNAGTATRRVTRGAEIPDRVAQRSRCACSRRRREISRMSRRWPPDIRSATTRSTPAPSSVGTEAYNITPPTRQTNSEPPDELPRYLEVRTRPQPRKKKTTPRTRNMEIQRLIALSRVPMPPSHDGKGDQQKHNSDDTGDVRHHGNQTGNVAGVRPDEADDRSPDEHGDHRS
jgi:hypothetical protein